MGRVRTHEQLQYAERLEGLIRPILGDRVRLAVDGEGFPIVPGRLGQLEYLGMRSGPDADGTKFKTPSLLWVVGTPPYFHNGSVGSLDDLIDGNDDRMGKTNQLSAKDKAALIAFLKTL